MSYNYQYKIVLIGDSGSGKSCFMQKYIENKEINNLLPTIGVDFNSKIIRDIYNNKIKIHIWDTSGNKNYRSIARTYFVGVAGAVLIYHTGIQSTFDNLDSWLDDFNLTNRYENIPIMLIGANFGNYREISYDQGKQYADLNNFSYSEVDFSSKEPISTEETEILKPLLDRIWDRYIINDEVCSGVKKINYHRYIKKDESPKPKESVFKRVIKEMKLHKDDIIADGCIMS